MMVVPNSSTFLPGLDTPGSGFSESSWGAFETANLCQETWSNSPNLPSCYLHCPQKKTAEGRVVLAQKGFPIVYSSTSKIHDSTKSSKLTHLRIHLLQDFTTQNKRCIDLIGETHNFCNGRLPMLVAPQDTNKTNQFSKDIPKKSALHAMLHLQGSRSKDENRPPDTSSSGRLRRIHDTSPCISIGGDKGWYRLKMFI